MDSMGQFVKSSRKGVNNRPAGKSRERKEAELTRGNPAKSFRAHMKSTGHSMDNSERQGSWDSMCAKSPSAFLNASPSGNRFASMLRNVRLVIESRIPELKKSGKVLNRSVTVFK